MKHRFGWVFAACLALASFCLPAHAAEITVDAGKHYQTIDGFGACLISWDDRMARYYERPEVAQT